MHPTQPHTSLLLALALVSALAMGASAQGSYEEMEGDILLEADLDGDNEVDIGDDDGDGMAEIAIREDYSELCWSLEVNGVDGANAAHIHEGAEDQDGGVVVNLTVQADGTAEGCTTEAADGDANGTFQRIAENPGQFYVNVHNPEHPGGAIRGQLSEQEDFFNGDFLDDNGDTGDDNNTTGDEDDGTQVDPQDGDDQADTPAPGVALALVAIGAAAVGFAMRSRRS